MHDRILISGRLGENKYSDGESSYLGTSTVGQNRPTEFMVLPTIWVIKTVLIAIADIHTHGQGIQAIG